jgi:hypothetical protein
MVINDVPEINITLRNLLHDVFLTEINTAESNKRNLLTYTDDVFSASFEYHNYYSTEMGNIIRTKNDDPVMNIFNFSPKNATKILKLLNLKEQRPQLNGIRVYANNVLPMHIDLNRGDIGRQYPIYSIVLGGKDSMIFVSNKSDGSKLLALPKMPHFVMYPTLIQHGAKVGCEHLDILQIQLTSME